MEAAVRHLTNNSHEGNQHSCLSVSFAIYREHAWQDAPPRRAWARPRHGRPVRLAAAAPPRQSVNSAPVKFRFRRQVVIHAINILLMIIGRFIAEK